MGESGSDPGSASPPADIRDLLVDLEDPSPLAAIHDRPVAEAAPEENIPADAPLEPVPTASAPVILTADESTRADPAPTGSGPVPVIRSRRARHVAPPSHLLEKADPDADDIEFSVNGDSDEDADEAMDLEMEEAEDGGEGEGGGDKADSEDEGLLADADMPIEELLRRYGVPSSDEAKAESDDGTVPVKGDGPSSVDQSLLDENLHGDSHTLLNDGGKRQRRARQVWTPEDNPPPPPKKVRIEEVKITPEQTPELSSEEEESEEEEEEVGEIGDVAAGERGMEVEEDPNAPKTRVPFLLRGTLRPYQHAGLDWLAGLYANNMNGILADEMGLGKTIQTISLLAHLACDRGVWGQHLVIVPTSVILNWEMEFKKFLPGFKVLTYYGSQKERKEKRVGWLTEHSWQVCITSYQIVLADQHIFRRKSWVYMILDEAHNIKNFRSQRWQTLLGFKAQRRLLLTGTPLQNNLMELWSLLYFLMPHGVAEEATAVVGFANHRDFVEWFSNPMDKAVESGDVLDEQALATVSKLHTLLRPFILRRLKAEVEKQLPGKFEHVVYCRLSKRQRFLYDEFMSRASTKDALTSGGYLGVMNTLMQLRKVCNHPDLFEVRPVRTSFAMDRSVAADFTPLDILVRKRLLAKRDEVDLSALNLNITSNESVSGWTAYARRGLDGSDHLPHAIEVKQKGRQPAPPPMDLRTVDGWLKYRAAKEEEESVQRWRSLRDVNRIRCGSGPIYGFTFLSMLSEIPQKLSPLDAPRTKRDLVHDLTPPSSGLILSLDDRRKLSLPLVEKFAVIPPAATARDLASLALPSLQPNSHPSLLDPSFDTLHHASTKLQIAFPDSSLLQYDCGKLQKLAEMLRDLKADGHRCLIFTQMTRVLDILEIFLNYNGHRYLRLDGSTKIEDRQIITERFNSDNKIFCFIASSRSGGVGINLTGADTVFFYDSDWNPSMDRQCMDRAHRIGQTREVHIYRFVSSHTVEENMLKKANQKRLLDKVIIQEGDFTTEFFGRVDWRETLYDGDEPKRLVEEEEKDGVEDIPVEEEPEAEVVEEYAPRRGEEREFAKMVAEVEDEEDVQAARVALGEGEMDMGDFEADGAAKREAQVGKKTAVRFEGGGTPMTPGAGDEGVVGDESMVVDGEEEEEEEVGGVDEYMLRLVEWDWASFASYR
ncbi:SNF2 family N-terminal domain-containing protein [Dioszegia hungarica]|uniref:Helicase SWR1 n=1 Tax=Dioszegia hungarica TaxID=4972 RepID=A0AA38HFN7_9TREE|nr:SNF2 family N-terminal domain-containing protein [Dioszegia hungarica]KAI9639277.1 SNF2 family N-terminal domain-containing protein [Dioszegia hungarica]